MDLGWYNYRTRLIEEVRDPDCHYVGPFEKSGEHEVEILALLEQFGLDINEDGLAVDADSDA